MEAKLTIELVPKTAWNINVRSELSIKEWNKLRKEIYQNANYRCEICGGSGRQHPVECHEVWEYDDKNHIQKLIRLIALCPDCHQVKHIGLAQIRGKYRQARLHLAKVNGWDLFDAEKYIVKQFDIWKKRSKHDWKLDISYLDDKKETK